MCDIVPTKVEGQSDSEWESLRSHGPLMARVIASLMPLTQFTRQDKTELIRSFSLLDLHREKFRSLDKVLSGCGNNESKVGFWMFIASAHGEFRLRTSPEVQGILQGQSAVKELTVPKDCYTQSMRLNGRKQI